ncbi:probable 26S proteasome non-ATPase regulatory subunit 3 isoform X4 [Olea europaea var. sylvestris]|uniref:probable 26S proteasome non-ATPase regulatory subunit 3 isoform X4 n=1 Tax=Olea europaea var. sylvestris TaxID=158386 RepID=UPI000C1D7391|nr:probable 26S proteasome non-ATPase regulatory subunit 3 isoform X4 [Olea europaea var. sylvestris]
MMEEGKFKCEIQDLMAKIFAKMTQEIEMKEQQPALSNSLFATAPSTFQKDEQDMELDTAKSATQAPAKHPLPELEVYSCLLVLIFLIGQKRYSEPKACCLTSIARLKNLNRRTVDVLASRLYFYYSLSYELTGDLAEIQGDRVESSILGGNLRPKNLVWSNHCGGGSLVRRSVQAMGGTCGPVEMIADWNKKQVTSST